MTNYLQLAESLLSLVTVGLMWQVWNIRAALEKTATNASSANSKANDNNEAIADLKRDHEEIKETMKNIDRNIAGFSKEVESKVEKIMDDHSSHSEQQARMMTLVEIIERKADSCSGRGR